MNLFEFTCRFCGAPSSVDPKDQTCPPPSYCHPEDHLGLDQILGVFENEKSIF